MPHITYSTSNLNHGKTIHAVSGFYKSLIELILHCDTATEGCVSNDSFRHSLDDSPASYLTYLPSPSLNTVELIVIRNRPCKHSSQLQLSIRFTASRCLDVRQDWYPMYYPEGMKARESSVQSIELHRIFAPTRDSNQEPPGPQSRVVTAILLMLHTEFVANLKYNVVSFKSEARTIFLEWWESQSRIPTYTIIFWTMSVAVTTHKRSEYTIGRITMSLNIKTRTGLNLSFHLLLNIYPLLSDFVLKFELKFDVLFADNTI